MLIGGRVKKQVFISEEYHAEYYKEKDEIEFARYTGTEDEYEVPERIEGYPVTRVGRYAFAEQRNVSQLQRAAISFARSCISVTA